MWKVRPTWHDLFRGAGGLVLAEQVFEAVFLGVSLTQNPGLVIAGLAALGAPLPERKARPKSEEA